MPLGGRIASRRDLWDLIRSIAYDYCFLLWCIFCDFNDLLSQENKIGINDHPSWLITDFREVVFDTNLHNLPMEGYQYTQAKRRGKLDAIEEKLDCALATPQWFDMFPSFKLLNLVTSKSYQSPILLKLNDGGHVHLKTKKSNLKILGFQNQNRNLFLSMHEQIQMVMISLLCCQFHLQK